MREEFCGKRNHGKYHKQAHVLERDVKYIGLLDGFEDGGSGGETLSCLFL